MHYYIDGYNLLFRTLKNHADFSKQRTRLIEELNEKVGILALQVTVVFDSQYQESESTRGHFNFLEILFTSQNQTADDCIIEEIKSERNQYQKTVVTSDKKLAWFARRSSAKTETVEHFIEWLNKRYTNKLRQLNELKKVPKEVLKSQPEPKPKIAKTPPATVPAENCNDYYLDQFQKEFERISKELPLKKTEKSKTSLRQKNRKSKKPPRHDEDKPLSDMDRWEHIFEIKLNGEDDKKGF
jgi:predicted RNA-binding protein with PIN domain